MSGWREVNVYTGIPTGNIPLRREDVSAAGHAAWAGRSIDGVSEFYYDGEFWRNVQGRDRRVPPDDVPTDGWYHERSCPCERCVSRKAA
jgi:hypothetical protein